MGRCIPLEGSSNNKGKGSKGAGKGFLVSKTQSHSLSGVHVHVSWHGLVHGMVASTTTQAQKRGKVGAKREQKAIATSQANCLFLLK